MEQRAIDTTYLKRRIGTLERALDGLGGHDGNDVVYGLYREMCVKEFELVLEQSGKLLRKRLRPWFASNRQADRLTFKDLFRHAAKHGLLPADACERWLEYRDNLNDTAHDDGEGFAKATLKLLPGFIADANTLAAVIDGPAMGDAPPANGQAAGALHLPARHRATLEALLHEHLPDVEVWAYGSRVNGRSHDGSDLDLVLRGPGLAKIDAMRYADFIEAVGESTIPFLVEAHDWARLPETFRHEIERDRVVVANAEAPDGHWLETCLGEVIELKCGYNLPRYERQACLKNGKTAYVDFLDGGVTGWGSTEYIVMRPKPPLPNVFAYCLARSPRFRAFLIRNMSGTSGRQRVSPQVLSQFLLPVPSERCAVAFGEAVRPFVARARDAALESHQLAAIRDILVPALISGALRGDRREAFSEAIDLQLKATVNLNRPTGGYYRFPLNVRNYNLLRIPTYTPRLLVVLDLPKVEDRWITITSDELILRRSAYWLNLNGREETDNQASVTVMIPENNLFDLDGLRSLMEQSRRGDI